MSRRFRGSILGVALIVSILVAFAHLGARRLSLAQGEPTATPNINWVSVSEGINVRGGPGLDYAPIGALTVGTWVQPLARSLDGEWIMITYLTTQGWVQRDGVSWRLNSDALPVIDETEPTPIPRPLYYSTPGGPTYTPNANWVSVGADGAFVRSGPGQGYMPIGLLFTGDVVDPVAHDAAEDWMMIRYEDGFGWIRVDLVVWVSDIQALPVIDFPELTPSFTPVPTRAPNTRTPTPSRTPSRTATLIPSDTPAATATLTASPTDTPTATATATSTASPSPTDTPTATATATSTASPSPTATMTGTATRTPSPIPPTVTQTVTPEPPTATASPTPTSSATPTATSTPEPSATPTVTPTTPPSDTATLTATLTHTPSPVPPTATDTPTAAPTATDLPSLTPTLPPTDQPTSVAALATAAPSRTPRPSRTPTTPPTATRTPSHTPTTPPSDTPSPVPPTATGTPEPSATPTTPPPTDTPAPAATLTPSPEPPTPPPTATSTSTATGIPTDTATPTPEVVAAAPAGSGEDSGGDPGAPPSGDNPDGAMTVEESDPDDEGRSPLVIAGGILAALAAMYVGTYLTQAASVARTAGDFPLTVCPVCEHGTLALDQRRYRVLGIPRVRRVIRCDTCRSVLRQVGRGRWRYAVDGAVNAALFDRLNGRVVTGSQLREISPEYRGTPPEYIEGDDLPHD